jgi:hypothetical protein
MFPLNGFFQITENNIENFIRLFPGKKFDMGRICNVSYQIYWRKLQKEVILKLKSFHF